MTTTTQTATDPEPFVNPSTGERTAVTPLTGFWVHSPRISWPQFGGRMVRRDYLRSGDWAISSHYGLRRVETVQLSGTSGQTTEIIWEFPEGLLFPYSERYDSNTMIELLTDEQAEAATGKPIVVRELSDGLFYLFDRSGKRIDSSATLIGGFPTQDGAEMIRDHIVASGYWA